MIARTVLCLLVLSSAAYGQSRKQRPRPLAPGDEASITIVGDESVNYPGVGKSGLVGTDSIVLPIMANDGKNAGADRENSQAFNHAMRAGDKAGVDEAITQGRGFRVNAGAKVVVLKRGYSQKAAAFTYNWGIPISQTGAAQVRILEGPAKGAVGWIPVRNLAPVE